VFHTLQRTDVLIKSFELQIFRVGIAGLDMQENACVRRSVLRGEFHDYAFMVGFGSVRDVRILMVSRNEPLLPLGGPLRNYILRLRRMLGLQIMITGGQTPPDQFARNTVRSALD
jgi:hypothetical protein